MSDTPNVYTNVVNTLADLYGLPPEVIDINVVTMMGKWAGPATFTPPDPYNFQVGYDHIIWGINAFIQNPADNPANFTNFEFNLSDSFTQKTWFQTPINFGAFLSTIGPGDNSINPLPAFRKLPSNATVQVLLSPAQFNGTTWAGAAKVVGITLYGCKINAVYMSKLQAGG